MSCERKPIKRINKTDPLFRSKNPMWNACLAMKREIQRLRNSK